MGSNAQSLETMEAQLKLEVNQRRQATEKLETLEKDHKKLVNLHSSTKSLNEKEMLGVTT